MISFDYIWLHYRSPHMTTLCYTHTIWKKKATINKVNTEVQNHMTCHLWLLWVSDLQLCRNTRSTWSTNSLIKSQKLLKPHSIYLHQILLKYTQIHLLFLTCLYIQNSHHNSHVSLKVALIQLCRNTRSTWSSLH